MVVSSIFIMACGRQFTEKKLLTGWNCAPPKIGRNRVHQYYAALVALNKGEAVFNSIKALQKPRADLDDRQTGFKVTQREYNWSGFYGDALVVSFDQTFPGTIAILSMFSGPR